MTENREVLLDVKDLEITFTNGKRKFRAVHDVNFQIYKGETFALVGESGSGKTTIGRAIIRLNQTSDGEIIYKGKKINGKLSKPEAREIVREIQMIFQDPAASLNERATVDYCVGEGIDNFKLYKDMEDRRQKIDGALESVGLLPEHKSRYPHEFSGGQRQRIGIARAVVMEPDFIIADEPISALDVSIRAQVLNLMNKFQEERGLTYLFIAHDLSVVPDAPVYPVTPSIRADAGSAHRKGEETDCLRRKRAGKQRRKSLYARNRSGSYDSLH